MIRKAEQCDVKRILEIYSAARTFMAENGNPTQWQDGYPKRDIVEADIRNGNLYLICEDGGGAFAVFGMFEGIDPTYINIDGKWGSDAPYVAVHRVASDGTHRGVFGMIFSFVSEMYDHIRIDTHKDNIPMQKVLISNGFIHRGTIYIGNGTPRMAFEWIKNVFLDTFSLFEHKLP